MTVRLPGESELIEFMMEVMLSEDKRLSLLEMESSDDIGEKEAELISKFSSLQLHGDDIYLNSAFDRSHPSWTDFEKSRDDLQDFFQKLLPIVTRDTDSDEKVEEQTVVKPRRVLPALKYAAISILVVALFWGRFLLEEKVGFLNSCVIIFLVFFVAMPIVAWLIDELMSRLSTRS